VSKKKLEFSLSIPALAEYVGVVRLAISGIATRMNFTIDEIEDIKISISEACTNAIQHAYGDNTNPEEDKIDIKVYIIDNDLEIIVKDFGSGFNLSILGTKEQKEKSKAKMGLGLGLTFIKSLMDKTNFKSTIGQGTEIKMQKTSQNIKSQSVA